MYNHEPKNYFCPFCLLVAGREAEKILSKKSDIFYHDEDLMAFIGAQSWTNNIAHVIIIPNQHIENLYDMPEYILHKLVDFEKEVAIALKNVYACDGISTKQHNEPAGDQHVWHYHRHVFPRYVGDSLDATEYKTLDYQIRKEYAEKLKLHFRKC